jgi:hypothetical protein
MYYRTPIDFTPDEVIDYLRKSQSDDPNLTVQEVLEKHETDLDEWDDRNFGIGKRVPQQNRFYEVVSGESLKDRSEMQKVLRLIESPRYRAVKVYDLQRLTRGDLEDVGRLMKLFKLTGTLIITTRPERIFDLRDEYDFEAVERDLKSGNSYLQYAKKVMGAGRLQSVARGNFIASVAPYGFNKITVMDGKRKCPTLEENPEQADVVRMIFDMYVNQDMGCQKICNRLDELKIKPPKGKHWSPPAMQDMLENIHYIGKVKWNWRKTVTIVEDSEIIKTRPKARVGEYLIYEGRHDGIISEELFNAAQAKKGRNARVKTDKQMRNALASILFCKCGRAMSLRTYKKKDGTERGPARLLCDGQTHCQSGSVIYDEMIDRVCSILEQCIEDFEIRLQNDTGDSAKLHAKLIKNLEAKLKALEAKELAQWEAQADPDEEKRMPHHIFKQLNEKLLKEKDEIKQALCKAYESKPEPVDYEDKIKMFSDALNALRNPNVDAAEKNKLLKRCIARIEYSREKPQRIQSKQVRYYDKEQKRTRWKSPLNRGGNWTSPPIELDVKLKV